VSARGLTTQYNSTWGLGAISHRSGSNDSYIYDSTAGEVTYAYVLDTGILIANAPNALTVAAADTKLNVASFTNYGKASCDWTRRLR
jgi:hypothetical protein